MKEPKTKYVDLKQFDLDAPSLTWYQWKVVAILARTLMRRCLVWSIERGREEEEQKNKQKNIITLLSICMPYYYIYSKTKNKYLMQSIFVQYIFCTYSVYFNRNLMNVDYRQNIWNQFNAYQLGFENFIESTFSTFERKLNQLYSFFIHIKLWWGKTYILIDQTHILPNWIYIG